MAQVQPLPSIRQLLLDAEATHAQIIGTPYDQWNCWHLIRYLCLHGLRIDLDAEPRKNMDVVYELWWRDDAIDPFTVTQPWDIWVFNPQGLASEHVGVVMDNEWMVQSNRHHGVTREKLRRWRHRLLVIYRLQQLR